MAGDIIARDAMDTLRAKVHEARERYFKDPSPENRGAYRRALRSFADWAMPIELPGIVDKPQAAKAAR